MFLNFETTFEHLSNTYIYAVLTIIVASVITLFIGWKTSLKDSAVEKEEPKKDNATCNGVNLLDAGICHCHDNEDHEEDSAVGEMTDDEIYLHNCTRLNNAAATAEKMIMAGLTKDQLSDEYSSQETQLSEIFTLMEQQGEKFGGMTMADMFEQMKLYR